jgi:dUTP pyrophosphatase
VRQASRIVQTGVNRPDRKHGTTVRLGDLEGIILYESRVKHSLRSTKGDWTGMVDESAAMGILGGVLSREQIRALIVDAGRPLLGDYIDLETQLQPNGFDVTLREISRYVGQGQIGRESGDRQLPELVPLAFDADGWLTLEAGQYHILYNEIVSLPDSLMALGRPRSSLGRSGVTIHTAVWDAGYSGRSTSLLSVLNPEGFRVQRDARVMQLVFLGMASATVAGYSGQYQGENVG